MQHSPYASPAEAHALGQNDNRFYSIDLTGRRCHLTVQTWRTLVTYFLPSVHALAIELLHDATGDKAAALAMAPALAERLSEEPAWQTAAQSSILRWAHFRPEARPMDSSAWGVRYVASYQNGAFNEVRREYHFGKGDTLAAASFGWSRPGNSAELAAAIIIGDLRDMPTRYVEACGQSACMLFVQDFLQSPLSNGALEMSSVELTNWITNSAPELRTSARRGLEL